MTKFKDSTTVNTARKVTFLCSLDLFALGLLALVRIQHSRAHCARLIRYNRRTPPET